MQSYKVLTMCKYYTASQLSVLKSLKHQTSAMCKYYTASQLSAGLDRDYCVCVLKFSVFLFLFFFFFWFSRVSRSNAATIHALFMNSSRICWLFHCEQCTRALFIDPQISLFSNFFIKNGSHGTIHTFKNYFATMFSVFNFQFQQNKFYSNGPLVY